MATRATAAFPARARKRACRIGVVKGWRGEPVDSGSHAARTRGMIDVRDHGRVTQSTMSCLGLMPASLLSTSRKLREFLRGDSRDSRDTPDTDSVGDVGLVRCVSVGVRRCASTAGREPGGPLDFLLGWKSFTRLRNAHSAAASKGWMSGESLPTARMCVRARVMPGNIRPVTEGWDGEPADFIFAVGPSHT